MHFYDQDASLIEKVAAFIGNAPVAIVIATPQHLRELADRLGGAGPAKLIALDAKETLALFMHDNWPDAQRFDETVGTIVRNACADGQAVHAFGEMVALLCKDGLYEAAIRLEQLWNELAEVVPFSLLCGYQWNLFPTAEAAHAFHCVCQQHNHTGSSEYVPPTTASKDAQLWIASIEQKARSLQAEIRRREKAEQNLQLQEQEFADFIENAAEGLHQVGADGTILWANKAELQLLGYEWDEYVGRHIADFHIDGPTIQDILSRLSSGDTLHDEPAMLRCKDGAVKHVLISSNACFKDGKLLYTRCFTRDATARRERDLALKQRDDMLRHAPVAAALLLSDELIFHIANRRYCEMMGRSDLEGLSFLDAFPELQQSEVVGCLRKVLATGKTCMIEELPLAIPCDKVSSAERFFTFSMEPLPVHDGDIDGVILIASDITEHVQARKALEHASRERELLLAELMRANRTKDEFLAMLGHELRNPLSPIVTALELMRLRGDTGTEREQGLIKRQVDHLVRLVDDLLDIARLTRGKIDLKIERVEVSQLVAKAIEIASPLIEQQQHRLETRVAPSLHIDGDPIRLAQVISNLLTNAARYTSAGGNIVLAATAAGDGTVEISVKDSGIGIPADMIGHIFDLFYQGGRGIDRAEGGLGIGLALVKNIIELHAGRVEARSDGAGLGSEFVVRLPVGRLPAQHTYPASAPGIDAGGSNRQRIMIVDDNTDAAGALGQLLAEQGHIVQVFHEPLAALSTAQQFRPDIAILDIGLPVVDGYELAAKLRVQLNGSPCRLIALTGYGQASDKRKSQAAGFEHHLVKPVQAEELSGLINQAAAEKR